MFLIRLNSGSWVFVTDADNIMYSNRIGELFTFMNIVHGISLDDIEDALWAIEEGYDNVAEFGWNRRFTTTKRIELPDEIIDFDFMR